MTIEKKTKASSIAKEAYAMQAILQRPVRRYDGRMVLLPPNDDLEQVLAAALGQLLHSHLVNNQKIRFQVALQNLLLTAQGLAQVPQL